MINICFSFKEDNQFEYFDRSCTAIEEGQGTYSVTGYTISLSYEPLPFFCERESIIKVEELESKIQLLINVVDYDSKELIDDYGLRYQSESDIEKLVPGISFSDLYTTIHPDQGTYTVDYDGSEAIFLLSSQMDSLSYSDAQFTIGSPGNYQLVLQLKRGRATSQYIMKEGAERYLMTAKNDSLLLENFEHGTKLYLKRKNQ